MLIVINVLMAVAGILFFSSVIILFFMTHSLFSHLERMEPEYYAKTGSPKVPFGFESISFVRQMRANKYLLSVIFGNARNEIANDAKASAIIKSIHRIWFFATLPSWIIWGAGIIYLIIKFPNGMS